MQELLTLTSGALPARAEMLALRATEALSRPYRIDLWIAVPADAEHELAEAIGGSATATLDPGDGGAPFHFHGVIAGLRLHGTRGERALYHVTLVPRLRLLSQSRHSRIHTKKSIPDVLRATLTAGGLSGADFALRLRGDYPAEEHVTQYQESDLDFVSRWMELEGMYYFFEHEEGAEKLVIVDDRSAHSGLRAEPVSYHPTFRRDGVAGQTLSTFTCEHRALPAAVVLRDYDYTKPALDVSARADVSRTGLNEVVVHNARFFDPGAAKRYARVRAEEMLATEVVFEASGSALRLRAGTVFELVDHPSSAMEGKYLVVEARHASNVAAWSPDGAPASEVYRVELRAIRADVQYRPRRVTTWPAVHGLEAGTIDGPVASEYAQIDDHGRYAVKLHFDESDLKDGRASTWVRMAQPHGGGVEGFHFPLRKGTEVMMAFLGGDPDRPVIVGVAPNALTPSPVTRGNHTTNVIQTGGRNRMELEDKAGGQRVTTFSPTKSTFLRMGAPNDDVNAWLCTEGNAKIEVGASVCGPTQLYVTTGGDKEEWVEGTTTETYHGPFTTTVTKAVEEHYAQKKKETVKGALVESFNTSQSTTVTGHVEETYASQSTHVTKGARAETVSGAVTETYTGPLERTVKKLVDESIGGTYTLDVTGEHKTTAANISRFIALPLTSKVPEKKEVECEKSAKIVLGGVTEILLGGKSEILIGGIKAETVVGLKKGVIGLKIENELEGLGNQPVDVHKKGGKFVVKGAECNAVAGAVLKIANAISAHGGGFLFKN